MIGLYYPEINFNEIKKKLKNFNIINSLFDLINKLEIKLIYLGKEIELTKIISFYTSRNIYLKNFNVTYKEDYIKELHEVINWVIIHKSNQLKGIASDKYLACKYVQFKLGKNLCQHRIAVYENLEQLNYEELSKFGDIVLKVSNSCWKKILISKTAKKEKYMKLLKEFKNLYLKTEHGLIEAQFFHLYAKKRIVVEKQFTPREYLYEFKFFILNNAIRFIYLLFYKYKKIYKLFYDTNFNFIFKDKKYDITPLNLASLFNKNTLEKLKEYAIKLSEDFPNFVRVDLYLFKNQIYFSELTFASCRGLYFHRNEKFILDCMKNFSRIDDYY